jgi:hypothetical protein
LVRRAARALRRVWSEIDAARFPPAPMGARPLLVLFSAPVLLTSALWFGHRANFEERFGGAVDPAGTYFGLYPDLWWASVNVLCYLCLPAVGVKVAGLRLSDFGLSVRGFRGHGRLYAGLYVAILPVLLAASALPSFQRTYPLAPAAAASVPHFAIWEAAYLLQFVALEFFFRGYLLFGLERHLGALAVPVMVIPYAMVHLGKPFPEVMASIAAGTVLGVVALHTRSILGGICIHYAVALTMDLLALAWKSQLFW